MTRPLEDKHAIVTGASSGLGRHFALTLAKAGAKVAVAARRTDRLVELVDEIAAFDGHALPVSLDVTDPASVTAAIETAETELGPLHILVNNAGVTQAKMALDIGEDDWDSVVGTNLRGAWRVAQETARHMQRLGHGGSIINIASILSFGVTRQLSTYAISKAAVVQMTKSLAVELTRDNIRVNAIAPGYIETDFNRDFFATDRGKEMVSKIPQKRLGQPSELDGALLLLAGDGSAYMTGSVITIDGGHTLPLVG
jgi:NAD(P)-dependent dehydrogenase (short-subunit alcohol dehydrogenase family)